MKENNDESIQEMRELTTRYSIFHADILESYIGTPELYGLKRELSIFDNQTAPDKHLTPRDWRYQIEKTAVLVRYIRENFDKEKRNSVEGILYTYAYPEKAIEDIKKIIHKKDILEVKALIREKKRAKANRQI